MKPIVYFSFLLLIFLFLLKRCEAQSRKVIVIYDTIRVVDTVRVRPPNSPYYSLHKPLKSINPIYTNGANYWDNGGYWSDDLLVAKEISENIKKNRSIKMLAMFAVFSKVDLNFSAGINNMWLQHHASTINNPAWFGPYGAFEMRYFPKKSDFVLSAGGNYSWQRKLQAYSQISSVDSSLPTDQYEYAVAKTETLLNNLESGAFVGTYSEVSIPLKLHYCKFAIQPFAGLLFRANRFSYTDSNRVQINNLPNTKKVYYTFDWGLTAGAEFRLKKHLGIKFEMNQGLRPITNAPGSSTLNLLGGGQYAYKMLQANFSMCFHFKEFNKETTKKNSI